MTIFIREMSNYADSLLKLKSVCLGTVHSVYRKTINLTLNDTLLALQTAGSPLSPLSLITELSADGMEALAIKKDDIVKLSEEGLQIYSASGRLLLSYGGALRYDLKLPVLFPSLSDRNSHKLKNRLTQNIEAALSYTDTGGFASLFNSRPEDNLSLMFAAAKKYMTECTELYQRQRFGEAAAILSRLLGLGIGLTPSGDDFLCGALAGLCLSGKEEHLFGKRLRAEIAARLSDTVDISAAFLSCALKGQYSLALNRLVQFPDPREIADIFSQIGHSSGTDTLCGLLYVLKLVKQTIKQ